MTHTNINVGQHVCGEIPVKRAPIRGSGKI
jgi:hypothetical protein